MTKWNVVDARRMTEPAWEAWNALQTANADLQSPFFRPEFTRCVAAIRNDVEVAMLLDGRTHVAFFPFQRGAGGRAQAVCGRLSEFHGVVSAPEARWSPRELILACGLKSWHFDHLPVSQSAFQPYLWGESQSPYASLAQGFDGYRECLRRSGSSCSQVERKARKAAREIGPLRFEFHTADPNVFAALIAWKTEQHRRTNVLAVLETDWVRGLLEMLRTIDTPDFGAPLSALYAGDELLAVHLGLRSRTAVHLWFPAYSAERDAYSPGLILLLELARHAAERGIQRIDFGRGEERYKQNFKTHDLPIAEGSVDFRPLAGAAHRLWFQTKRWVRTSPWRAQLEAPLIASRRLRQWAAFR
jgi:CelD/BcsL family acetyltransferase involved in cellulose biosynthesis